jgi:hypothetical protein
MRTFLSAILFATLLGAPAAQAEKRVFVIANQADDYGIDRCLASGARCGAVAAASYCRSHQFAQAVSFRKIDRDELTGSFTVESDVCNASVCKQMVAIECSR